MHIYFIGIGGIGMSAIARYLNNIGKSITGYDKTSTQLTKKLESEGIDIHYIDDPQLIPEEVELVIYTPAIPDDHQELQFLRQKGLPVIKRAEALGMISRESKAIAVAGTHGKTSTCSLITQLLKFGACDFSAFVGGIILDDDSNYISRGNEWVVLEADEYDRSFLHLNPEIAILLSMDPDHLDIYVDHETMKEGFWQFIMNINPGGQFFYAHRLEAFFPEGWKEKLSMRGISHASFGIDEGNIQAQNVIALDGNFIIDYHGKEKILKQLKLPMPGYHNVENAIAAISASLELGVEEIQIIEAMNAFGGVQRRFEKLYDDGDRIYVDDYAHHPTELSAAIAAARKLYPGKKLTGVFQPHLFSRTKDFAEGFGKALDLLDECILMDIYPARELPIQGVTSQMIIEFMKSDCVMDVRDEDVMDRLKERDIEVLMTLGAGDIDLLRNKIRDWLERTRKEI
ncbi:MAG: UDP-N-acetylmuramate--L-alanine ligase [Saprospiraceae bacterium]|nr:UDP-N-acetylmuramate--L-alanine ligase [Saprospiraceae bacterium]